MYQHQKALNNIQLGDKNILEHLSIKVHYSPFVYSVGNISTIHLDSTYQNIAHYSKLHVGQLQYASGFSTPYDVSMLPSAFSSNMNDCWYSFKNCDDLPWSKKREYTFLISSTSTSVPWKKSNVSCYSSSVKSVP